jgi:hypothetical protein
MIITRIIFDILLFLSVFLLPWWLAILFGLFLIFKFNNFYEFIFLCLLIDSLYGKQIQFLDSYFIFTLVGLLIFIIINKLKQNLRY